MKILLAGLAVGVPLLCCSVQSFAGTMYFTDRTTWSAFISGMMTDDYESYVSWTHPYNNPLKYNGNVTLGAVTYGYSGWTVGMGPAVTTDLPYLSGSYLTWWYSSNPLTITLPYLVNAVAFDYGNYLGTPGLNLSITLGTGGSTTTSTLANSFAFFGAISDTSFNSLVLSGNTNNLVLDNVSYGQGGAPVPEPATMILFGTGLAGLVAARRKKAC